MKLMIENAKLSQRVIELADMESERMQFVFEQTESTVKGLVKILVDET